MQKFLFWTAIPAYFLGSLLVEQFGFFLGYFAFLLSYLAALVIFVRMSGPES